MEEADEDLELLLLAALTTRACDLGEAAVYVEDFRRLPVCGRRQALGGETEVAGLLVELDDLILWSCVGGGHRVDEQLLAETDLDRLKEWGQPALDEVGDRAELVGRGSLVNLRQDPNQLVAALRALHPVEV